MKETFLDDPTRQRYSANTNLLGDFNGRMRNESKINYSENDENEDDKVNGNSTRLMELRQRSDDNR